MAAIDPKAVRSATIWNDVQAMLGREQPGAKRARTKPRKRVFILESLITCGWCGSSMVPHYALSKGTRHFYYRCAAKYDGSKDCKLPIIQADQLEQLVEDEVRRLANTPELLDAALAHAAATVSDQARSIHAALREKAREKATLERQERNLVDLVKQGGASTAPAAILEELQSIRQQISHLTSEIAQLEQRQQEDRSEIRPDAIQDKLAFFEAAIDLLSPEQKAEFVASYVQNITYTPELVRISVYNDPLDDDTRKQVEHALAEPERATTDSSGFLQSSKWLGC